MDFSSKCIWKDLRKTKQTKHPVLFQSSASFHCHLLHPLPPSPNSTGGMEVGAAASPLQPVSTTPSLLHFSPGTARVPPMGCSAELLFMCMFTCAYFQFYNSIFLRKYLKSNNGQDSIWICLTVGSCAIVSETATIWIWHSCPFLPVLNYKYVGALDFLPGFASLWSFSTSCKLWKYSQTVLSTSLNSI